MKSIFQDKANQGGVYKIINLLNGRIYIGSTVRFKERARGHKNDLLANRHLNSFLQNDYNKCGSEAFLFEVIEVVLGDKAARLAREQYFLDQHYDNQKICYNLARVAKDNRGGTRNKETIDPVSDGRCKSPTPEVNQKRIDGLRMAYQDPELLEVSRQNSLKRWKTHSNGQTFTHKATGEVVTVEGSLKEFCSARNLSYKAFHFLSQGKTKASGGWYLGTETPIYVERKGEIHKPLTKAHRAKIAGGKFTGMKLTNKAGSVLVVGPNVKAQCQSLGLHYTTFLRVLKGTCGSVGGWYHEQPIKYISL